MADKPVPSFEKLVEDFKACPCGATAFAKATEMFLNYPQETKALVPNIKSEELNFDHDPSKPAGLWEHAAALAEAKRAKSGLSGTLKDIHSLENVTLDQIQAPAQKLYDTAKQFSSQGKTMPCGR